MKDIVVDNCAICRNHIMDLCIECQANQASATSEGEKTFGTLICDSYSHAIRMHGRLGNLQPRLPLPLYLSLAQNASSVPSWYAPLVCWVFWCSSFSFF